MAAQVTDNPEVKTGSTVAQPEKLGQLDSGEQVEKEVWQLCSLAKEAQPVLAALTAGQRAELLTAVATQLRAETENICRANQADLERSAAQGMSAGLLDRLALNPSRINAIAAAVEEVRDLPDPVGQIVSGQQLSNGLQVRRERVPLGVVAMIYEARPNVTVDAAVLCLKSGNAVILRGGSAAEQTNRVLVDLFQSVLAAAGLPKDLVATVDPWGRAGATAVMRARGLVDLLIPRGGAGLIQSCVQNALVPVIETGVGNCHIYVDASADLAAATAIILNAKTQRVGVCNAAETLLIDRAVATAYFPEIITALLAAGVQLHLDEASLELVEQLQIAPINMDDAVSAGSVTPAMPVAEVPVAGETIGGKAALAEAASGGSPLGGKIVAATAADYATEYLSLDLAVAIVDGVAGAIKHIRKYSTGHTEAVLAQNVAVIDQFVREVDSAAIAVNTSTRFTDGGQLGLGAEIGISTQKMHARGPFALTELTTVKWIITGQGQIRE